MDNKLNDLNDIDGILRGSSVGEIIERKRARRMKEAAREQGLSWQFRILIFPVITVVLIIIILILDREPADEPLSEETRLEEGSSEGQENAETAAAPSGESMETESETEAETEDPSIVREYYDDVLEAFFQRFFDAKLSGDVDTLCQMSGVTRLTEEQKEHLSSQLKVQAGYIESYRDIRLYSVRGVSENERLVFITYNVKFRRAELAAPAIMYCYVTVNEKNEFELVENMLPEQVRFINEYIMEHPEVEELINATNSRLLEAISSDSRLAVIYDAFQTGRIYTEDQSSIESEVSLISIETEAAEEESVPESVSENEGDGSVSSTGNADTGGAEAAAAASANTGDSTQPDETEVVNIVIEVEGDPQGNEDNQGISAQGDAVVEAGPPDGTDGQTASDASGQPAVLQGGPDGESVFPQDGTGGGGLPQDNAVEGEARDASAQPEEGVIVDAPA